jgi:hypothetical protein
MENKPTDHHGHLAFGGDHLNYRLTSAPRGMSIDSSTGRIRWQPDDQQLGSHLVSVQVTDALMEQAALSLILPRAGSPNVASAKAVFSSAN